MSINLINKNTNDKIPGYKYKTEPRNSLTQEVTYLKSTRLMIC